MPKKAIAARLWQLVRPQRRGVAVLCGLMLVGVGLELVPPKLQQILVDDILAEGRVSPGASSLLTALLVVVALDRDARRSSGPQLEQADPC